MNADGSDATRLTDDPAGDAWPAFSADGTKIAFVSRRSGEKIRDIFVMNADGSGVTQVTHTPELGPESQDVPGPFGPEAPAFHPDGGRVVFSENSALFVVRIDGSTPPERSRSAAAMAFLSVKSRSSARMDGASRSAAGRKPKRSRAPAFRRQLGHLRDQRGRLRSGSADH